MAYETGSVAGTEELITKLFTFLTDGRIFTTPWVQDNLDVGANKASIHLGNCYVHFLWDASTEVNIGVYQSLGFTAAGTQLDQHPNDSGNGNAASTPVVSERRAYFHVAGPWTKYHFFAYEDTACVYVVVEESPGVFRHPLGFGNIDKLNDWTGGEFAYGAFWNSSTTYIDVPNSGNHVMLLDGSSSATYELVSATMHLEGMPNGPASHKWGVFTGDTSLQNDGDGNGRCILWGGSRGGPWVRELSWMHSTHLSSLKVLIPITVAYRDTTDTPDEIIFLGQMHNVAVVNLSEFNVGDEITVGADTWIVFPWARKLYVSGGSSTDESRNAGWAYKKVPNP